jgi:hypothetical protein
MRGDHSLSISLRAGLAAAVRRGDREAVRVALAALKRFGVHLLIATDLPTPSKTPGGRNA